VEACRTMNHADFEQVFVTNGELTNVCRESLLSRGSLSSNEPCHIHSQNTNTRLLLQQYFQGGAIAPNPNPIPVTPPAPRDN